MVRAITCNCGVLKGDTLPGFFLFLFKGKIINGSRKFQSKEGLSYK